MTDPLSGTVLDVGRTRYRPPAGIRDHVNRRDGTCARPLCSVPAQRAEFDHTVPFGADAPDDAASPRGPTSADNGDPLCTPDHTAKTLGLLHIEQPSPGVFDVTTPTGLRYRSVPGLRGRTERLPRKRTEPGPGPTTAEGLRAEDPPPF